MPLVTQKSDKNIMKFSYFSIFGPRNVPFTHTLSKIWWIFLKNLNNHICQLGSVQNNRMKKKIEVLILGHIMNHSPYLSITGICLENQKINIYHQIYFPKNLMKRFRELLKNINFGPKKDQFFPNYQNSHFFHIFHLFHTACLQVQF